jgi:hypothetical protein
MTSVDDGYRNVRHTKATPRCSPNAVFRSRNLATHVEFAIYFICKPFNLPQNEITLSRNPKPIAWPRDLYAN